MKVETEFYSCISRAPKKEWYSIQEHIIHFGNRRNRKQQQEHNLLFWSSAFTDATLCYGMLTTQLNILKFCIYRCNVMLWHANNTTHYSEVLQLRMQRYAMACQQHNSLFWSSAFTDATLCYGMLTTQLIILKFCIYSCNVTLWHANNTTYYSEVLHLQM